jgi:hypothetical protein
MGGENAALFLAILNTTSPSHGSAAEVEPTTTVVEERDWEQLLEQVDSPGLKLSLRRQVKMEMGRLRSQLDSLHARAASLQEELHSARQSTAAVVPPRRPVHVLLLLLSANLCLCMSTL